MDKSGVTARPFKGRKKKIVFLTGCPAILRFRDALEISHVSLVGTISLRFQSLRPLLVTKSNVMFKSYELLGFVVRSSALGCQRVA
jgi:hypothetical protein